MVLTWLTIGGWAGGPVVTELTWDPGLTSAGTQVYSGTSPSAGDSYFRIQTQNTAVGAWRTALRVLSGEADLYLRQGGLETDPLGYAYGSTQVGSDGLVLHTVEFQAAQEWHLLVRGTAGARWTLVSGEAYVQDLGSLALDDTSGSGPVTIGPEGICYFKTTVPSETLAWRLWLNGDAGNLYVMRSAAPVPRVHAFDLEQGDQMLVVPDYLDTVTFNGSYFVGVPGAPGAVVELDSRQQAVTDVAFASTGAPVTLTGYGYATYRVQVPVEQIAWQIDVVPLTGDPSVAVRREKVPNEYHNDAFSEVAGNVMDSLTLVPPTLSDGTFYVTVYGSGPYSFRLQNGGPVITPISYVGSAVNAEMNRVGWRFFAVSDIDQQLGSLGWHLFLQNAPADTQIAIRRNAVPGLWNYRVMEVPDYAMGGHVDALGVGFLQEPGHQADIWYVGVYNPQKPLDGFTLVTEPLTAQPLSFAGGVASNSSLMAPRLDYYAVTIPNDVVSWRVKVTAQAGDVRLLVLKDQLPLNSAGSGNVSMTFSPPGRLVQKPGNEHFVLQPRYWDVALPAGTYYLGVGSDSETASSYVIESLGPIAVASLGTVGATDLTRADTLEGGEVKAYGFDVPAGLQLLEVWLENRVGNPVMAVVRGTALPQTRNDYNILGSYGGDGGTYDSWIHSELVTLANPEAGAYRLIVKATAAGADYPDATYTLRLRTGTPLPAGFDDSHSAVAGHQAGTWRFFRVEVPADALGWDLRLADVVGGDPLLVVRRDLLPPDGVGSPGSGQWPSGAQWSVGLDWTGYGLNSGDTSRFGRILVAGMGSSLEPGTYYVGVLNNGSESTSYTLVSRGIGARFTISVQTLAFAGGSILVDDLPAGEAAYYRVTLPASTPSWKAKLTPTSGEGLLVVQRAALPDIACSYEYSVLGVKGGKLMQKPGQEHLVVLPPSGETVLPAGDYYLAVVSEGQDPVWNTIGTGSASAQLQSLGSLAVTGMGTLSNADLTRADTLVGGEVKAYEFTVASGVPSVEVRLENCVGNPVLSLRSGSSLPQASDTWTLNDYGADGGEPYERLAPPEVPVTVANPAPGVFRLIVKGAPSGNDWPDATFTIRVRRLNATPLAFDGGTQAVNGQGALAWQYFRFEVPSSTLGWDLRLLNASGGRPGLWICRDLLPDGYGQPVLHSGNLGCTEWPSGSYYAVSGDWTSYSAWPDGSWRLGQVFGAGLGHPLEAGTYYVGVLNSGDTATSYTLSSLGVGAGFSKPVQDLPFQNGVVTGDNLGAGDVAYYRVDVPAGTPSWKVKLTPTRGDVCLVVQQGVLPNVDGGWGSGVTERTGGKVMQKSGNEHLTLLPPAGETSLVAGTYYLAVISDGINPSGETMGAGSSQFELASLGSITPVDLGSGGAADVVRADERVEGGALNTYRFTVPKGAMNIEVRLEDQVGQPGMSLRAGDRLPESSSWTPYGTEGGEAPMASHASLITVPEPVPGVYSLVVKGSSSDGSQFPDATYLLRIRCQEPSPLNFSETQNGNGQSHTASGILADNQSAFYLVTVPADLNGAPVLGWQLDLEQTQGSPVVRVRKGGLPVDGAADMSVFVPSVANLVSPLLVPGDWCVEVRGQGYTEYTLTSRPLVLQRPAWAMPAFGQEPTTPGVTPPEFADSGIDEVGQPIEPLPSDLGIDLAQGDYHYYAIQVPAGNAGLMRVQLQAISGNPDLYVRVGEPPTRSHGQIGWFGIGIYDRFLAGTETEYGNFVPTLGQSETELTPGLWYLAVHAAGDSNVRYRLKASIGDIRTLAMDGGAWSDQTVAAGDWRYYRVDMPLAAPTQWRLTFSQQVGDVVMVLRDTVPPGLGANPQSIVEVDWSTDHKNAGPYARYDEPGTHLVTTPPLRPGAIYYVGFKAKTDAAFSVSSAVSGTLDLRGTIAFYGGTAAVQIPPGGQVLYRVDVPVEGTRWRSDATHGESVVVHVEQGSVPQPPTTHSSSVGSNSILRAGLDPVTWPWQPGQSYFLLVANGSDSVQPWSITLDGRNANTEDDDEDGLLDVWERRYFGNLDGQPGEDPDGDALTNLQEFQGGTDPTVSNAVLITLGVPEYMPDGRFQFRVAAPAGISYRVEVTEDWTVWTTVASVSSSSGSDLLTDAVAPGGVGRYYRAVAP